MYSKQHEIESFVEDVIENEILNLITDYFSTKKECEFALNCLKEKIQEVDDNVFDCLFE